MDRWLLPVVMLVLVLECLLIIDVAFTGKLPGLS
jgi:hypothetical protein